jgi:RHS repeat-associated protein
MAIAPFCARATTPAIGALATTAVSSAGGYQVTATSQITTAAGDPALIAGGVNLLRVDGAVPTILGVMHDDGLNGDTVAGDGIYTLVFTATSASIGQMQIQVAAAFRGLVRRLKSTAGAIQTAGPSITSVNPNAAQQGVQGLGGGGSIFLTGHDADFHAVAGANSLGAQHINQAAIQFITDPAYNVFAAAGIHKFLYVTSTNPPPGYYGEDGTLGLIASGFVEGTDFDRADASILAAALGQLGTTYGALVVASDYGGILTQAELDILNQNLAGMTNFLNSGGGLYAMAETAPAEGGLASTGFYGFLPFAVTSIPQTEAENGDTLTVFGAGIGLANSDINGNFSQNTFASTGGLTVVDTDAAGEILTLAGRGQVTPAGVTGVVITGAFTNFVQGVTTASFGSGVTVTSLTVTSATSATAILNIDPTAPVGTRNVRLTTGSEIATLNNGFTVTGGTPLLTLVFSNNGEQGQQNESITVIGLSTHWVQGATAASFGAGVTVASLTIHSATSATAVLNIDPAAAVGSRNVTFTTGYEVAALTNGFSVTGIPVLTLVTPNTGQQSQQNETVNLTGQYTHWAQGTTTATFGDGGGAVNNPTVPGIADLWLAGQPNGTVLGGDSAPTNSPVLAWALPNLVPGAYLTFAATGVTDYGGCQGNSPDGDGCGIWTFGPSLGISQFMGPANALIGVFVNASSLNGPAPAGLDFSSPASQSLTTISPLLNQVFFIGDGLTGTGSGSVQQFIIPVGATQLYLGSGDSAGANYNNSGSFKVVVTYFGAGITVTGLTVNSATTATAVLDIDPSTVTGPTSVTVTTGAEVVGLNDGFTVTAGPKLLSISPASALAGQANLPVTIAGQLTHFTNASVIDLGPGMTLSAVSATDATHLSAQLTVAGSGNLVQNGSLEDLSGFFVNTESNYMALYAGATTIAGWTVTPSTLNEIVWAQSPTGDTQYAADGTYFVNLTGFGADSPNGAISQQLQLISGQQYTFSMDTLVDTTQPAVTIGSMTVALSAGQPFQVYTDLWVPQTGTFVADSANPVLTIANQDPSQQHCYIDNIAIAVPGSAALGAHSLTVSTGTEIESLINAFTVNGAPVVLSVTPAIGSQTQTNVPVTITGQYTHFSIASVVTFSGAGVTAGAPTAATATSVTVPVSVAAGAALGSRQIQVQAGSETASLAGAYTVIAPVPALTQVSANTGLQGQQNESVSVTGQFTHWVQGTTTGSFGAGVAIATLTINSATTATAVLNIDPAATTGVRDVTFTTGSEVVTLTGGFTVNAGAPVLTLISPNSGVQGQQNLIINVTGSFTHWVQDGTGASFGDGVTPTSLNVTSPTSAWLYVNIDPAAVPGPRTVTLYTATETATLNNGFTVTAGTPVLTLVNPNSGLQGQQNESVNLTGQYTHWAQGTTTASFGTGVTVATLTVNSATSATAVLNVDPAASTGARNVSLTTGSETVTLVNGFTVVFPTPAITSALPGFGLRGQAFQVAITGQNTHFQQGITEANFGPGVSVGGSIAGTPGLVTVTSPTTATASVSVPASAAMGSRTILVQTGTEDASLINGFVVKGPPYLSSISPNSAQPGDTLTAAIHGTYTSFQQGVTTATFGAGISVGGAASGAAGPVTVSDSGDATAQLTIDPAATPGLRNPVVQTGAEQASLTNSGFTVLGPVTGPAPVAPITSPSEGDRVTTLTTVTGSITSPNLANWVLEYQAAGANTFTQFGSGTTTTVNAVFDPTMLLNGIAQLRLTATDVSGQTGVAITNVVVAGRAKVGNFSLAFNDLTVPVAGIPIQIVRSYDSRNKSIGDFGLGWSLDIESTKVQTNGIPGDGWTGTKGSGAFGSYCVTAGAAHVVTITLQDGTTYTFQPTFTQSCTQVVPPQTVNMLFTPTGTTPSNASLSVPDGAGLMVFGDFPGDVYLADPNTLESYDPDQFILTLPNGLQIQISKSAGVQNIVDRNNRSLTFTPNGILSSTGAGVAFTRDDQNRIVAITDPNGNVINYSYSAGGDLTQVQDALNHVSTFTYDSMHDLVSYVDGTGHQPVRNVYDDSGRLIQVIDAFGNVTNLDNDLGASTETVTDKLGNQTTVVYDADGNIISETDALGHVTTTTYDASDHVLSITDALGHTTAFAYDATGNQTSQTDASGHTAQQTYDGFNNPLTTQDANGNISTNTYDGSGNLSTRADAAGNVTSYSYNSTGSQTSATDPLGHTVGYAYTSSGKVATTTDPSGVVTSYTYDANGNRISESVTRTTPAGAQVQTTQFQYDAGGNLIGTTYPDGSTTSLAYDANGRITSKTDQLGRATVYTYDDAGRVTQVTYPDGRVSVNIYDANGQRTQVTDPTGSVTTLSYDALGRLVGQSNAGTGTTSQTAFDAAGNKLSETDPLGHTTQYTYDAANHKTSITDALHHVTTFTYDAAGNQVSTQDANGNTTTQQFDSNNHPIKTVYPDGTFSQTTYDGNGRAISKTDPAGNTTQFAYDSNGRLVTVTDAVGHATHYGYDEVGNRTSQTDANGHTTTFAYDALKRVIGRALPGGQSESFAYDIAGNLLSHTDFNGKVLTYAYDAQSRIVSKTPDPSFQAPAVTYTYTADGLRASMTDGSGTSTYTYDSSLRLIQVIKPNGTLFYTYDLAGNLTSISTNSGTNITYSYDADNRLASVTDPSIGVTTYTFDAVGNMSGADYPEGISSLYTYNKKNQLTGLSASKGAAALATYSYTLGLTGRRLSVAELGGRAVTYTYDNIYRLTSEIVSGSPSGINGAASYTWDPAGNRLQVTSTLAGVPTVTSTYDADDRLATETYDANGNTTSSDGIANLYDFENHLVQHGSVTITYDGDGNRVSKTVGGITTKYLVDDQNPTGLPQVLEESSSDGSSRKFVYGLQRISQKQLVVASSSTLISFYIYDGLGSVRALADAGGAVTDAYDYDAFGNLIDATGSTPNEFLFAGEQFDADLGLYYNRARYLKPSTGRFFTLDALDGDPMSPVTLHKYLYANGDPVNTLDPSGNQGFFDDFMATLIANTIEGTIASPILRFGAGGLVAGVLLTTFLPPDYWDEIKSHPTGITAGMFGGNLNVSVGHNYIPLGGTFGGGVDLVWGRYHAALYFYYGGGLTFGETSSSVGAAIYGGPLWRTNTSYDYEGAFNTVTVPLGAVGQWIKSIQISVLEAVSLGDEFILKAYSSQLYAFANLVQKVLNTPILNSVAISLFYSPPSGGSMGFSVGLAASEGTSSNISITQTWFTQFVPFDKVLAFNQKMSGIDY